HPESRSAEILDEVDHRAFDEIEADGIDDELHSVGDNHFIILLSGIGEFELVRESGTAAAVDSEAEYRGLVLPRGDPGDALGRVLGKADQRLAHTGEIGSA